jgi:hypothetical protein
LSLSLLIQAGSKSYLFFQFLAEKEYIVKNICVQKDMEENTCCGQCHLKEQLDKDDAAKDEAPENKKEKDELISYYVPFTSNFFLILSSTNAWVKLGSAMPAKEFYPNIIKPPTC